MNSALLGDYNVDNALIAMTIMSVLGCRRRGDRGGDGGGRVGRRPLRRRARTDVTVIVDYAHTPEGLRRLLEDVRAMMPEGRVITVFGCGGDRDRAKRPEMGLVASTYSDLTIVTSDNPRSESPESIIDAVMSRRGERRERRARRRPAQRHRSRALDEAAPGDVVVVAGKGHETTQTIGDLVVPFDDRVVARELLR